MLPKPSYKYSEAAPSFRTSVERAGSEIDTNLRVDTSTTRERAVVSCPSCRTSFSVAASYFANGGSPTFHCSRCDVVFSTNPKTAANSPSAAGAPSTESSTAVNAEAPLAQRIETPRRAHSHNASVKASDFSIGTRIANASDSSAYKEPTRSNIPRLSSYEDTSEINAQESAPLAGLERNALQGATPHDHATRPISPPHGASSSVTEKLFSGGFEITARGPEKYAPQISTPPPASPAQRFKLGAADSIADERIDEDTYQQALREQRSVLQKCWQSLSLRNRSLISAATPLVTTVGLLLALTPLASVSPHSLGALIDRASPAVISNPIPRIPPASLSIKKLTLRFEKTQSHETVAVVSGTLVNSSNTKLTGITVEALAYNRRGEVTASSKAPLRSALAKERISDLTLDTVKKFQASLNARSASIAPGETVPFSIVLLDPPIADHSNELSVSDHAELDLSKMKYFSARVFSVHQ